MSKERARLRAKSNALKKAKKRAANAGQTGTHEPTGHFDPGNHSIKGPAGSNNRSPFGGGTRGSARSK
ncbi:MAG: hypothetical protein JKY17_05880 [Magnetovibrio sp.]|nr:hypothetical protein [Magnetovibrio sp.]